MPKIAREKKPARDRPPAAKNGAPPATRRAAPRKPLRAQTDAAAKAAVPSLFPTHEWLTIRGARHNNLKNVDAALPLGRFVCVTGVSGSGKSSLVNDILYNALARKLNGAETPPPGEHDKIEGLEHLDKIIAIDQTPIGRTPRSNPATYIKLFDEIRDLFTQLPDAKLRGYKPGRFSFNVAGGLKGGGRCEACEGNGANRIEMDFLADVWVRCPVCEGKRFTRETLQMQYKGKSIADVLEMDVQQALRHFENIPRIAMMLQTLHDVGLDYIKLGQPSPTLSGGEAQRIKLARELVKKATGRTLYVLDEPTTGLHFVDIRKLLAILHGFVDAGNTVLVIEHNLDVVKTADWLIDLGPEGGEQGGRMIAEGTPEEVAACAASYTGQALKEILDFGSGILDLKKAAPTASEVGGKTNPKSKIQNPKSPPVSEAAADSITVAGARQHNLKDLTVSFPRNQMTVCTGVSGSGKTSFAIDTVFTEGYRRYVESLSAYARQFLGQLQKPKVEHVEGLSPAICIEQKAASKSPRSTVGTITEIYDYMRVLWARAGTYYCPRCQIPMGTQTIDEIVDRVMALDAGAPIVILAPISLGDGETWAALFNRLKSSGYARVRIDGQIQETAQATTLDARRKHRVEVVIDRTVVKPKSRGRITESIEHALALGNGLMVLLVEEVETIHHEEDSQSEPPPQVGGQNPALAERGSNTRPDSPDGWPTSSEVGSRLSREEASLVVPASLENNRDPISKEMGHPHRADSAVQSASVTVRRTPARELRFSQKLACLRCGESYEELSPNHFSFNSPLGWCETCEGLGVQRGAPAAVLIKNPGRSLFDGAIAGWSHIERNSPLAKMLVALCDHLGVKPDTPLKNWTPAQKQALMFGTSGEWIDGGAAFPGVRFHWRGFFPTVDAATRHSWELRFRLANVVTDIPCTACRGGRLRPDAAAVRFADKTAVEICNVPLGECLQFFKTLKLDKHQRQIAGELLKEIENRLQFLIDVGLDYLTLHRAAPTLSGGEAQRIRLASQIGSGLSGVLYVLDEPTIGLHPRDTNRLVRALVKLRDLGNTLLLVEHDRDVIRQADRLLDFGPRAGTFGGRIVAQGKPTDLQEASGDGQALEEGVSQRRKGAKSEKTELPTRETQPDLSGANGDSESRSLTRAYLTGTTAIPVPTNRRPVEPWDAQAFEAAKSTPRNANTKAFARSQAAPSNRSSFSKESARAALQSKIQTPKSKIAEWLVVRGARQNNLKNLTVPIPLGRFVCVTGVSGSGKSSLINDILWPALANKMQRANHTLGEHDGIDGIKNLDKVINVDQSPLGTTPLSNPATYTSLFDWIRELFTRLPDSKMRGYNANRFSFNRPGGRCEACQGYGQKCIEMHFMPDVWVECETCKGRRYNPETLEVKFKDKSIADVLEMRVAEALGLFENVPKIRRMLETLADVGLDYVQLGQSAPTLSGGEAQRVKLATELGKPDTGRTLYILDEPTTGLHFDDVRKLLNVLHRLTDLGNTVLVVEHNLDVLKNADWIIDLGPEAGDAGGNIVAMGTPEQILEFGLRILDSETAPAAPQSKIQNPKSKIISHTAAALKPVLEAGPYAEREVYDLAKHVAREMEIDRAGLGKIGREVKMPWQIDGRKWHLKQRTSRADKPIRWQPAALEFTEELVQEAGAFEPTNWNDRASVEIIAPGAEHWFFHALTGGEWLLELYFRIPPGTFDVVKLAKEIGLKTLDEREDLPVYGNWPRVDIRNRQGPLDAAVVYAHDKKEIDTPAFRRFIKAAAAAYLKAMKNG